MRNATPSSPLFKRARQFLDDLDRKIFLDPDLDALSRGWLVSSDGPFRRTYRDPGATTARPNGVLHDGQR